MLRFDGLTLTGFKSFVDRTELTLPEGISCVVGPNGCGKSNIVDAITWVLGEQRPRFLRGSKMEDVIFAGTRSRKPAGLAEVGLRFSPRAAIALAEDVDSQLKEPLEITRRLYRNGDSEYLVNGERVRLKDVTQLLTGTGLTTRAYSIIGQGRVEQILNSKPTDRRVLLEEAAGITGYRQKRRVAKLKLDQSEHDLLRVTDIVAEIEKQLRSLKRQASSARRYRRLAGRQRAVHSALHAARHDLLVRRLAELDAELGRRRAAEQESAQRLAELEESARSARERVAELEQRRDDLARRRHELQLEVERARSSLGAGRERLGDNEEQVRRNERARSEVRAESQAADEELAERRSRVHRLEGEVEGARARLAELDAGAVTVRDKLEACHRLIAETKENIFEVMSEAAGLRNRRQEAEQVADRLQAHADRLAEASSRAEEEARQHQDEVEQARAGLKAAIDREDGVGAEMEEAAARLSALDAELDRLAAACASCRTELHDAQWRLAAVGETIRSRAAYREGVRRYLDGDPPGALGALAELIQVSPGDELACEKALGPLLEAVVHGSREEAFGAAARLAAEGAPEVRFVHPGAAPAPARPAPDGRVLGPIGDSVSFASGLEWLEGSIPAAWLVQDAATALDLAARHPDEVFVSRDGLRVGPSGQVDAGRPLGDGEGILETRARHDDLLATVEGLEERSRRVEAELARVQESRDETSALCAALRQRLGDAEKAAISARHALEGTRQAAGSASARLESARFEHASACGELQETRERIVAFSERLEACQARRAELDDTLAEAQRLAVELESETARASSDLSRVKEELTIKSERLDSVRVELQSAARHRAQLGEREALLDEEAETLAHQRRELTDGMDAAERSIEEGGRRWAELKATLHEAEETLSAERGALVDSASRLRELRLDHDAKARSTAECEVQRERTASDLDHLKTDCRRDLGVEAEDLALPEPGGEHEGPAPPTEPADEGDDEVVVDRSLPWLSDGRLDLDALAEEAEELRGKLARIGPVNLVAIEEHDELAERHGFLAKERDDLLSSIHSLRRTIADIDQMSRERFSECFEVVKGHFDEAFQTLFRGGRAELRLQDADDPLESGVEITAQPPGKRLQNMMLLSGGEKALTAIALLFALFRYKPSPFCILDEVDAPLDEANVVRFVDLVNAMSSETQFILVTHNRRSMEQGRVLYGVTMEEPGCSKLVAVEFESFAESSAA